MEEATMGTPPLPVGAGLPAGTQDSVQKVCDRAHGVCPGHSGHSRAGLRCFWSQPREGCGRPWSLGRSGHRRLQWRLLLWC